MLYYQKIREILKSSELVIFKKMKNYKIWAMNLSSDCFVIIFLIQYLDSLCKDSIRNWVSTLLPSEMYWHFYRTGVNIITHGKSSGVPLNILSSVLQYS